MLRTQKELADAYLSIGKEQNAKVAPVGLAWAEARRRFRTIELHIRDGSHPTPTGSYLAALVIYATLTGRTPIGAPALIKGCPTIDTGPEQETVVDPSIRVPLVDLRDATAVEL